MEITIYGCSIHADGVEGAGVVRARLLPVQYSDPVTATPDTVIAAGAPAACVERVAAPRGGGDPAGEYPAILAGLFDAIRSALR